MSNIESAHHHQNFCDCCGMPTDGGVFVTTSSDVVIFCGDCVVAMQNAIDTAPIPTHGTMTIYRKWLKGWRRFNFPPEVKERIESTITWLTRELED